MKPLLFLALLGGSALVTGCHEVVVDHHHHRPAAVVVHDRGYDRGPGYYGPGYYHRGPGYYAPAPRRVYY